MKLISNEIEKKLVNQEINALRLMSSPNVVKMFDCFHTQNNTYIITEYCNQGQVSCSSFSLGDLSKLVQKCGTIPEPEAMKIMKHIVNGFKE
jgi:serine/threonine protein kinase